VIRGGDKPHGWTDRRLRARADHYCSFFCSAVFLS
jgi:hypothetical protein